MFRFPLEALNHYEVNDLPKLGLGLNQLRGKKTCKKTSTVSQKHLLQGLKFVAVEIEQVITQILLRYHLGSGAVFRK